jgi:predicted DCC family thiol-disulfide oxidoreductase YuxK
MTTPETDQNPNHPGRASPDQNDETIVLIDGICVLCSRSYQFVHARDPVRHFRFLAIQQPEGRALAAQHGIDPDNPATFVLIDHGTVYLRSDAALRILAQLPGWSWTRLLRAVPRVMRDAVYDLIARNRYRWFGRLDRCLLPNSGPAP